jgi:hypothetical protein
MIKVELESAAKGRARVDILLAYLIIVARWCLSDDQPILEASNRKLAQW